MPKYAINPKHCKVKNFSFNLPYNKTDECEPLPYLTHTQLLFESYMEKMVTFQGKKYENNRNICLISIM